MVAGKGKKGFGQRLTEVRMKRFWSQKPIGNWRDLAQNLQELTDAGETVFGVYGEAHNGFVAVTYRDITVDKATSEPVTS